MARRTRQTPNIAFDPELADLPPEIRWREWMNRVEAVLFAASQPVERATLARVVGRETSIDLLIDDIRDELRGKPYDLVAIGGGWQLRTRPAYADTIHAAMALPERDIDLTKMEMLVLASIAYHQPITRGEISDIIGQEASRDTIAALRDKAMIGAGPRSPTPGAPYTYVTTKRFLEHFGLNNLRDLPDLEALADDGLRSNKIDAAGPGLFAEPFAPTPDAYDDDNPL